MSFLHIKGIHGYLERVICRVPKKSHHRPVHRKGVIFLLCIGAECFSKSTGLYAVRFKMETRAKPGRATFITSRTSHGHLRAHNRVSSRSWKTVYLSFEQARNWIILFFFFFFLGTKLVGSDPHTYCTQEDSHKGPTKVAYILPEESIQGPSFSRTIHSRNPKRLDLLSSENSCGQCAIPII